MRECRFECESVDSAAARAGTSLSQGAPAPGSHEHGWLSSPRAGEAGCGDCCNCGDECGGTAATEGAGGVRRDCCTAGEGLEQARGEFVAACGEGLGEGGGCERLRRCGEETGRERGCCDRCCTAANGRMGVVGAAALGSRKVCAAGCATAEGAVRAQGVYPRGAEACRKKRGKWRCGALAGGP